MKIDTEISQIRLLLTTSCNCRCRYCLIAKTNELMSESTACNAIKILLSSKGKKKMALLYGGEPLLHAGLVKKITNFSLDLAKKAKKQLKISIATNGLLLEKPILDFFRMNGVLCSISTAGTRPLHDKFRVYKNGIGTFKELSNKTELALKTLSPSQLSAIICVHPTQIGSLFDNFMFLLRQGFENFNIEIIFDKGWTRNTTSIFVKEFNKLMTFVYTKIREKQYIYINPFNRAFQDKNDGKIGQCCELFKTGLEVWPNGSLSFYPYIGGKYKARPIIGNIAKGLNSNFAECDLIARKAKCDPCCKRYYSRLPKLRGRHVLETRDHLSDLWGTYIQKKAIKSIIFKDYIKKAITRQFE